MRESDCEDYGEHRGERLIYQDADCEHWECTVCGAEWFMDLDEALQ